MTVLCQMNAYEYTLCMFYLLKNPLRLATDKIISKLKFLMNDDILPKYSFIKVTSQL